MRSAFLVIFVLLLAAPIASAELYQWVDAQGRLHFAQELHNVPAEHRGAARRKAARAASSRRQIQTYSAPVRPKRERREPKRSFGHVGGGSYEVPVERAGSRLLVNVRINDEVEAPFYIDTGASEVLVPRWVVESAGIDLDGAPTHLASTANGLIEVPTFTLDSIELHGARVEGVPAAMSNSLHTGLLGLSFLNHFEYSVDPAAGIVTLRENDLGRRGAIAGSVD